MCYLHNDIYITLRYHISMVALMQRRFCESSQVTLLKEKDSIREDYSLRQWIYHSTNYFRDSFTITVLIVHTLVRHAIISFN